MQLKAYFAQTEGIGVLVTADVHDQVDVAISAWAHLMEDGTIAFIYAGSSAPP